MKKNNFYENINLELPEEIIESIHTGNNIRIERIISKGNISPEGFWYEQEENEWIILISGSAEIQFENLFIKLLPGDYILIPAYEKHRVSYTDKEQLTLWLAVFYKE